MLFCSVLGMEKCPRMAQAGLGLAKWKAFTHETTHGQRCLGDRLVYINYPLTDCEPPFPMGLCKALAAAR
ncbi:MAG: hypothetical protein D6690_07160 [Nitrospirae bacterium]|nr:MAG: hypothetical protein D6690_07160 [Nitrospirota bacterium]